MIVRTLRTWAEIDRLSDEWNDLLGRSEAASIFLSWEWVQAWRVAMEDAVDPYVISVRGDDGRLIGIAPLYVASIRLFGVVNFRTLRFFADTATGAEYPDWIADSKNDAVVADAIAAELKAKSSDWDVIWLPRMAGWTGAERRIGGSAESAGLTVRGRECEFTHVELPQSMEVFEASFSAKSRQTIRRNVRRLTNMDGVEFSRCETREELPVILNALFDLHQLRWEAVGADGCFRRKPVEKAFYREMAPIALSNNWLWLFALKENGVVKAVQYGYVRDGTFLQLQEGYDPNFHSGAGNALRHHVLDQCIRAGVQEYDFLTGVSEHKRRWGGVIRLGRDVMIGNSNWRSRLLMSSKAWPTGRFMNERGLATGAMQ